MVSLATLGKVSQWFEGDDPSPGLTLVRSHLKGCVQCWSSQYKKDVVILERGQHRASKMHNGFFSISHMRRAGTNLA